MKKKTQKRTKKNPQDATLRNIRALKKKVSELELNFANLMIAVIEMNKMMINDRLNKAIAPKRKK